MIIFEGVDRVGKSTTYHLFNNETNFRFYTSDRGILSYISYDILRHGTGRLNTSEMKQVISHSLPERLFIVLLFCSEKEYLRRCRETKHEVLPYKEHNAAFSKALVFLSDWVEQENKIRAGTCSHGIKLRVVSVDTTNLPEDRLKIICHKIEEQAEDFYAK